MRTLRQCGLMAIYDGITTIEEVARETLTEE
jgi:type II secretory ATPase GspE/PulE/Tfp pilus assembly ATPase PilB-like protein